jgi:hypothetical protein
MKTTLFLAAFVAALTVAGAIPARTSFAPAPLPATLRAEPDTIAVLPYPTLALAAYRAATADTYALAVEYSYTITTVTAIALGPNQPDSSSGSAAPMTLAERRAVARSTFD